ncbi:MAG TPA: hypothetical protein VFU15_11725 [Bacteroidia bacterium]|nr:hypothetical protein [Bacteroidia bacterium]
MKKLIAAFVLLLFCRCSFALENKLELSYTYLYSGQWDKAIQAYNFSRPFLANQQPLFMNGLNASASHIFKPHKVFSYGITVSYLYFRSSVKNENFLNTLNLHFADIGWLVHFENTEKPDGFYSELAFSAVSSGLFRTVNRKSFRYDGARAKAFGIGGDIHLKAGYEFSAKNNFFISPFAALGYTPFLFSPNTEGVINQTTGLTGRRWTGIVQVQAGIALHWKKET